MKKRRARGPSFCGVTISCRLSLSLLCRCLFWCFCPCHLIEADGDDEEETGLGETQIAQGIEAKPDEPEEFGEDRYDDSDYRHDQKQRV
jgi:hypothetical protein